MADEDVKDFLTAWDLKNYIAVFEENDIDIKTLPFLKEDLIKELIPSVGHRARFITNLDDWRSIITGLPNTSNSSNTITNSQTSSISLTGSTDIVLEDNCSLQTLDHSDLSQILSPQSIEGDTFSNSIYLQLDDIKEKSSPEGTIKDVSEAQPYNSELLDLLKSENAGRGLLATYLQSGLLDSIGRKYSKKHLKPKFHFLTHYHSFIKKFGPVIHLWSMRYEAKHKTSKISARSSFNRRNICKTLAIKHQLKLNEIFINGKLCNKINVGPQTELDCIKQHQIQNKLNLNVDEQLIRVNWAEVGGTRYKPKTILTLDILNDNNPQFAIVQNVFLHAQNRVIFECNILTTIGFDEHVYSYEITLPETNNICYVFQDLLLSHVTNTLSIVSNGTKYITLRSPL